MPGETGRPFLKVPYVDLISAHEPMTDELLAAVRRVIEHGWFILGPEVRELEEKLAALIGAHAVIGVSNGTDALKLALRHLGVGPGDEVVVPSHSYMATASCVALVGARPVFADVDPATMQIDPGDIEATIGPKTRAVIAVHLNGQPCDIDRIAAVCEARGIPLVEDCAQAIGVRRADRHVGTRGIGCYSMHPLKNLSALGDAGFICARDEAEAEHLRKLRNQGLRDRDHCEEISDNARLDTIHAAMLLAKLPHLPASLDARRRHANAYREALAGLVTLPPADGEGDRSTYSAFVVRHPERDLIRSALKAAGVDAKVHYPLGAHQQPAFAAWAVRPLPHTERVVAEILSLPVHAQMSDEQREHVCATIRSVLA